MASEDISVGDILYLEDNSEVPCDVVILCSSDNNGLCYVQVFISSLFIPYFSFLLTFYFDSFILHIVFLLFFIFYYYYIILLFYSYSLYYSYSFCLLDSKSWWRNRLQTKKGPHSHHGHDYRSTFKFHGNYYY